MQAAKRYFNTSGPNIRAEVFELLGQHEAETGQLFDIDVKEKNICDYGWTAGSGQ